jgi:Ca-activated chloride channel family protein
MRKQLLLALIVVMVALSGCIGPLGSDGDDGDIGDSSSDPAGGSGYDASGDDGAPADGSGDSFTSANPAPSAQPSEDENLGYSVGGASDINNFRDNIGEGYLPLPADVTPEGTFKEYYFDTGESEACEELFCPSYSQAVSEDPISGEREQFMTVGLNSGISQSEFERSDLNLVVVVDTSGSMDSPFGQYYYDDDGNRVETDQQQKIAAARDSVESMLDQLRGDDRVGIVSFSDGARTVAPMQRVDERDMSALRDNVQSMNADGGTNLDAGMQEAEAMVEAYAENSDRETRIVYVTDAMPNSGATSTELLGGQLSDHADRGIYSTFIGVGIDFNAQLVDQITGIRGANYHNVQSGQQFQERMDEGFRYMVSPLVFDLSLELDAEGYEIAQVHGTTSDAAAEGNIFTVETLFPSQTDGNRTKGGVILVELERKSAVADSVVELTASYENQAGERSETTEQIEFQQHEPEYFENDGIRKAVALARYAELSHNWLAYEWATITDEEFETPEGGIEHREAVGMSQWERQSEDLRVSTPFPDRFETYAEYFEEEIEALGDDAMYEELQLIYSLLDEANSETGEKSGEANNGTDAMSTPARLTG